MRNLILLTVLLAGFAACEKERECPGAVERTIAVANFRGISAGETFTLNIQQGAAFSVKAKGCENDLNDLAFSVDAGGTLQLAYNRYGKNRHAVSLDLTLPTLNTVNLGGAAKAAVTGFAVQGSRLRTITGGTASCTVNGLPVAVEVELSGTSTVTLNGSTAALSGNASGAAKLNAYTATATDVDLDASGTAKVYVQVQNSLVAFASGDSRIYYKGAPARTQLEQSGTAKIIHE